MSRPLLRPDLSPLRGPGARGFRAVFTSRTVAMLGSQAAEVAVLVQAKQLTGSPLIVGLLGLAELVPLVVFGLYGGALADRVDLRALMRRCEPGLACCAGLLLANALLPHPPAWPGHRGRGGGTWGLAMAAFGLSPDIYAAIAFLVIAGGADELSAIFRDIMWNQSIPDNLRGRMAGIELLSYAAGPPAGQLRSGLVASAAGIRFSLASGGLACVAAVGAVFLALPQFRNYRAGAAQ